MEAVQEESEEVLMKTDEIGLTVSQSRCYLFCQLGLHLDEVAVGMEAFAETGLD